MLIQLKKNQLINLNIRLKALFINYSKIDNSTEKKISKTKLKFKI